MNDLLSADIAKLRELGNAVKEAQEAVSKHRKVMTKHCAVRLGDEVVCNGYSHIGKTIVVDRVWLYDLLRSKYQFRASGKIKKKDGTLGSQVGEWYESR